MNTCPNCGLVLNRRGECGGCGDDVETDDHEIIETDEDRALCAADDARKRDIEDPNK